MKEWIQFSHIQKSFYSEEEETRVIEDLSFSLHENEIVCLLGPSGCGKSTILNLIADLDVANEGDIVSNGAIGYMFQKDNLLPWRTVYQNVVLGLEIQRKKTKEMVCYVRGLLQKYGLTDFENFYPHELSGGMKQRVSLIRTLALKPDVLLLDEPFSALDSQTRLFVQEDVYQILRKEQKSALIVTHDISEAIALADRILILSERPMQVKRMVDIRFPKTLGPIERRKNPLFNTYFTEVYQELNHEKETN